MNENVQGVPINMDIKRRLGNRLFRQLMHCKLTRRRRSNSIYITVTTLWPRCSSMFDLSHMCKQSKFIQLHLKNSKRFCSFQYLFNKKSYAKKHTKLHCYLHFTLVWRGWITDIKCFINGLICPPFLYV